MHCEPRDRFRRLIWQTRQQTAWLCFFPGLEALLRNRDISRKIGPPVPLSLLDAKEVVGSPENPTTSARVEAVVGDVKRSVRSERYPIGIAEPPGDELRLPARGWNAKQ